MKHRSNALQILPSNDTSAASVPGLTKMDLPAAAFIIAVSAPVGLRPRLAGGAADRLLGTLVRPEKRLTRVGG
jgi:hypothetical protein